MPGVIHKKRDSGVVFPPDWREIGYSDTPESTMDGFNYAKDIEANWDTSVHTYIEAFRDDYKLMYFPNMSYEKRYSMERCDRMFQNSNLEYFESDLPFIQQFESAFASCRNLRYVSITGMENWGVNTINQLFVDCYQLEEVNFDFSKLPSSCIRMNSIFSGCWNLKNVEVDNEYIESAITAFQNTYKLEETKINLPKCYNISFYAAGSQTDKGALIHIFEIGTKATQGVYFTAEKCKLKNGSIITVSHCNNVQSAFRQAVFKHDPENIAQEVYIHISGKSPYDSTEYNTNFSYCCENLNSDTNISFNADKPENCNYMFNGFTLSDSKYLSLRGFKFSTVTTANYMFKNCTAKNIYFANSDASNIDFSSCTSMTDIFSGANNFSNDTINNILLLLSTASSYTGTKTLAALGFTSAYYPAATIQSLSNYTAFTTAGWIIGY